MKGWALTYKDDNEEESIISGTEQYDNKDVAQFAIFPTKEDAKAALAWWGGVEGVEEYNYEIKEVSITW